MRIRRNQHVTTTIARHPRLRLILDAPTGLSLTVQDPPNTLKLSVSFCQPMDQDQSLSWTGLTPVEDRNLAGRKEEEIWTMDRYISANEVFRRRLAGDEGEDGSPQRRPTLTAGATANAKQVCDGRIKVGTVPRVRHEFSSMAHAFKLSENIWPRYAIQPRNSKYRLRLIPLWSYSEVNGSHGGILRIAAREAEQVRKWLRMALEAGGSPRTGRRWTLAANHLEKHIVETAYSGIYDLDDRHDVHGMMNPMI